MNSNNSDCAAFMSSRGLLAVVPADSLESLTGTPKWGGANVDVMSYTCAFHALISPNVCHGKGLMLTSGNCNNMTKASVSCQTDQSYLIPISQHKTEYHQW